jgi:hypothetical protein
MRASLQAASCLALIVLGGCQTIEYGPLDGEAIPTYGYQETPTGKDGEYVLLVRALGGESEVVHLMWDRRAREVCGPEFQKTLYRAERPTVHYQSYGGMPGHMILEGFLRCGAAVPEAASPPGEPAK